MTPSEFHHVVFCCSGDSGLVYLAAAARSLFECHSRPEKLRLHVIYEHLDQADLDRLHLSWQPWSSAEQVFYHRLSDTLGERAKDPGYGYWFRAWMHLVLPIDVERVLYLDYDLLVLQDVSPLWEVNIEGYLGAMVEEPDPIRAQDDLEKFAEGLGMEFDRNLTYFNTGVIMVNVARWRASDMGAVLDEKFAAHRPHNCLFDQGEINLLFGNEFLPLPAEYNVVHAPTYDLVHREQLKAVAVHPIVLHFAGPEKVTKRWRRLGEKSDFYDVLDRTDWKGWRSDNDRSLSGRLIAQLLEYRFLFNNRRSLPDFSSRLFRLIGRNPALPLLQLIIPLIRRLRSAFKR
ncbi:MAG TPA: hypothetical protein EYO33_19715 [Phycisphaerales bacterium]|nr:hypothetical protein [Phycisphaerales bacterium]